MIRVFDAHADTPFELWRKKESLTKNTCHIDLEKCKAFSEYRQVFAFCSLAGSKWEISQQDFLDSFANFQNEVKKQSMLHPYFSVEGPEVIDFAPEKLHELQFSMSTLTWNADNILAGCHLSDRGLTSRGKDYVKAAQEIGVLIDVSHLSEVAFWDLIQISQKPICASHSNCRSIFEHTRNLSDDQLRTIAQTGGVVGLNLYVGFLGDDADFETLRRHLEHMLLHCGENHVCLGGDLDGCDQLPRGFCDVTGYADFYDYLQGCGYDSDMLDKIFYRNLARVLKEG